MTDVVGTPGTGAAAPPGSVSVRGVRHRFTGPDGSPVDVLAGLDLQVEPGEFVALVGPSGCGKSTLLRLLAGFLQPTAGQVVVDGRVVTAPAHDRGVVFQQPTLYPWLNVLDNVAFGLKMRGTAKAERYAAARAQLELVGLADVEKFRPYELSGGMQQRVQLARVLANDPSIVLMDEPFGALDAITRDRLQDELLRIWRSTGKTVLFITHSVDEAVYLGSRVLVMSPRPGRIVLDEAVGFSRAPQQDADVRHSEEFVAVARRVGAELAVASTRPAVSD